MSEDESYVHPLLEKEVEQVQRKFGHNSIETRHAKENALANGQILSLAFYFSMQDSCWY